jgi:hypothetical protein
MPERWIFANSLAELVMIDDDLEVTGTIEYVATEFRTVRASRKGTLC